MRAERARRGVPLPVLLMLAVAAVVAVGVFRQWFSHLLPIAWLVDFAVYREMGRAAVQGVSLYDLTVQTDLYPLVVTYPPFAAIVFTPFGLLGLHAAGVLWTVINLLALAGLVWLALGLARVPRGHRRLWLTAVWTVGAVALDPVLLTLVVGQVNIVIAALVLLDLSDTLPERWRGYALGVAAGIKLIPLIFVAHLVLTRRWATALRAGLTFAATVALGFALLPRDSVRYWIDGVVLDSGRTLHSVVVNHSIFGFLGRVAAADVAPWWALPVGAVAGLAGLALAAHAHRRGQETVGILVVALTSLLVSPITWALHGVWFVPVMIWLAYASRGVVPKLVLVALAVVLVVPLYEFAQHVPGHQNTLPGNLVATAGGLLLPTLVLLVLFFPWQLSRLSRATSEVDDPPRSRRAPAVSRRV